MLNNYFAQIRIKKINDLIRIGHVNVAMIILPCIIPHLVARCRYFSYQACFSKCLQRFVDRAFRYARVSDSYNFIDLICSRMGTCLQKRLIDHNALLGGLKSVLIDELCDMFLAICQCDSFSQSSILQR